MKPSLSNEQIEKTFKDYDIRVTAVRLMIWKELCSLDFAFALCDLEGILPTVDRSTIFRALTLFVEKGLLHTIDDGSGQQKYCICHEYDHASEEDECEDDCKKHGDGCRKHEECHHVHLSCTKCGRTFCLRNQKIPPVQVPEGFEVLNMQYVIQGICPHCSHKRPLAEGEHCCTNIE